jgi:hypothetical protein
MLKLYRIELKGVKAGNLPKNCSPGITYVIAPSMDAAHMALISSYKKETESTGELFLDSVEIDTLEVIASEETTCNNPNFYKLVDYRNAMSNNKESETNE